MSRLAVLLLAVAATAGSAQAPHDDSLKHQVVQVLAGQESGGDRGTGFIVSGDSASFVVVTAQHVVNGCDGDVEVRWPWGSTRTARVSKIWCSEDFDLAVLTVSPGFALPPPAFRVSPQVSDGTRVWSVGFSDQSPSVNVDSAVTEVDGHPLRGQITMMVRTPMEQGFSGAPIITEDGALAGMILRAGRSKAFGLAWTHIEEELASVGIDADRVSIPAVRPNPSFSSRLARGGQPETLARMALRSYVRGMEARSIREVIEVRPDLPRSDLEALFGDARSVDLRLSECSDLVPTGAGRGCIACTQDLTIHRRTGPPQSRQGERVSFTLAVADGEDHWRILSFTSGAVCPAAKR